MPDETTQSTFRYKIVQPDNGIAEYRYRGPFGILETWRESLEEVRGSVTYDPDDVFVIKGVGAPTGYPVHELVFNPQTQQWVQGDLLIEAGWPAGAIHTHEFLSTPPAAAKK